MTIEPASVTARETAAREPHRVLHAASMLALFCVGVYAGSFGPALPFFAADLGVSLDTAGLILTALFAGSITASGVIAVALPGHDTRLLAVAGLVCIVAGALLLGLAPVWSAALAGGVVLGLGDGLVIAALHILVSMTSRDIPGAINRLNLYFAFGAVAGPLWAGGVLATAGERALVYGGIAALAAVTAALLASATTPTPLAPSSGGGRWRQGLHATAWVMGFVLFLYVGAEFGLGSWISSYARESANAGVFGAALISAGFWAALALGRVISGVYFARRRESSLLLAASAGGAGLSSLALALASGNIALSALAAFGAGLCLGPVWPTTVAIAAEGGVASATAATVTMGNAGGLVLPWAQGKVLVGAGPGQGVAVTAVLCGLMFCVVASFRITRHVVPHEEPHQ